MSERTKKAEETVQQAKAYADAMGVYEQICAVTSQFRGGEVTITNSDAMEAATRRRLRSETRSRL